MNNRLYFEDIEIGATRQIFGRTITETDIVLHAGHSGDFFPHHVDAEFCKTTPFGQRIAHGTMILTIGIGLTAVEINPVAFTYGYDRIRFVKPVFIGDTIHTCVTIARKEPDQKRETFGRVFEACEVINQHDQVVMACEHILLVERSNNKTT